MATQFPLWYPKATKVDFTKRNPDALAWKVDIDQWWAVVNHVAQGFNMNWFVYTCTSRSSHFSIEKNGKVYQTLPLNLAGWHAGRTDNPTWSRFKDVPSRNKYIKLRKQNPNLVTIGIEHAGFTAPPEWLRTKSPASYKKAVSEIWRPEYPWPEPMVEATVKLHEWFFAEGIIEGDPSSENIIGHNVLDPVSRANDPGSQWYTQVFPQIMDALKESSAIDDGITLAYGDAADDLNDLVVRIRKDMDSYNNELNKIINQFT